MTRRRVSWWDTRRAAPSLKIEIQLAPWHWAPLPRLYWDDTPPGVYTTVEWLMVQVGFGCNWPPFPIEYKPDVTVGVATDEGDPDTIHIVPTDDLIAHTTTGDDCPCGPATEAVFRDDGSNGWLIKHHSLDGRERHETQGDQS